jgi:hypothetical protein
VEAANVHTRASNRRAKRKVDIPDIVAADLPPNKPNLPPDRKTLRFTPESIPQGELTSLMQPQPLAEVHPFAPTLWKWQQGIPVDCGPDWERSVIEAAVDRGPHPMAQTPESSPFLSKTSSIRSRPDFAGCSSGRNSSVVYQQTSRSPQ